MSKHVEQKRIGKWFKPDPDVQKILEEYNIDNSKKMNALIRSCFINKKDDQLLEVLVTQIRRENFEFLNTIAKIVREAQDDY